MTSRAVRLYARLLVLYPRGHREEYGADMVHLFSDRYRDERPGSDVFQIVRFWGGMIGDLVRTAAAERMELTVSRVKQKWWMWVIGLFAVLQSVFLMETILSFIVDGWGADSLPFRVIVFAIQIVTVGALIAGLRMFERRPRRGAALIIVGLVPVALAGAVFFWFPPMWLVSALGIYMVARVLMEVGRIERLAQPMPA